jgi:hypothetical protein
MDVWSMAWSALMVLLGLVFGILLATSYNRRVNRRMVQELYQEAEALRHLVNILARTLHDMGHLPDARFDAAGNLESLGFEPVPIWLLRMKRSGS